MKINTHWPEATTHLIALALGWCLFSALLGLLFAFDSMEASKVASIPEAIPEFLQVTAITFLVGSLVLSLPIFIWQLLNKA